MSAFRDLTGMRIGYWKVLRLATDVESKATLWVCECQCQYKTVSNVSAGNLMTALTKEKGGSRSCKRCSAVRRDREPKRHARTQQAWTNMVRRCLRPNAKEAPTYAGMYIDPNWATDYFAFLADMGECPPDLEIDRIENGKEIGYRKSNCRWVPTSVNCRNKDSIPKYMYNGQLLTCTQIADAVGGRMTSSCLYYRLVVKGMSLEEALSKPVQRYTTEYEYNGVMTKTADLVNIAGVNEKALRHRISVLGWTVKEAVETPLMFK